MVKKYRGPGRHLLAKDVDPVAIQEPHLHSHVQKEAEYHVVKGFFDNIGYDLLTNFVSEGRGGAALLWKKKRCSEHGPWGHACLFVLC